MMFPILLTVAAAAILTAVGVLRRSGRQSVEPATHLYRCPECGQKVRYSAKRAGRDALCPRCRSHWALPTTPQPLKLHRAARAGVRLQSLAPRRAV
jgi:DNA-directed RNA polymerase subunit RPC12/RpoP